MLGKLIGKDTRLVSLACVISVGFATMLLVVVAQNLLIRFYGLVAATFVIWVAMAALAVPIVLGLLEKVLLPRLARLSSLSRRLLITASIGVGVIVLVRNPRGFPPNLFLQQMMPPALADVLGMVVNGLALGIGGGFIVLTLLLLFFAGDDKGERAFWLVATTALLYLVIGVFIYDDYGLSIDEGFQRFHGLVNAGYVLDLIAPTVSQEVIGYVDELAVYHGRYYGVVFQLPLLLFERLGEYGDNELWFARHYITFLFFFVSVLFFYKLAEDLFKEWAVAWGGMVLLILTPRIFAHGFYNVKDAVFLGAFTMALFVAYRYLRQPGMRYAVALGFMSAVAINIRIVAFGIPVLFITLVLLESFLQKRDELKKRLLSVVVVGGVALVTYIIITPASWGGPIQFFYEALATFGTYDIVGGTTLYMGVNSPVQSPPWHYIPGWMLVTLPLVQMGLFAFGVGVWVYHVLRRDVGREEGITLINLLVMGVPLLAAILADSSLYNGWRHFMFIYAPFMLVAAYGLKAIVGALREFTLQPPLKRFVLGFTAVGIVLYCGFIVQWMVAAHPYQNVYFNAMVTLWGGGGEAFERDYWLLSGREGFEYIVAHAPQETIRVGMTGPYEPWFLQPSVAILPFEDARRIEIVPLEEGDVDYIVETYRHFPADVGYPVYYVVTVDGLDILTIYQPEE